MFEVAKQRTCEDCRRTPALRQDKLLIMIFASHPMNSREARTMSANQCINDIAAPEAAAYRSARRRAAPAWIIENWAALIREAPKERDSLLERIERAIESGNRNRVRDIELAFFRSRLVKLAYLIEANAARRAHRRADLSSWNQRQRFLGLAMSLSVFLPSGEAIFVKGEPKASGTGLRITQSFGLMDRARQAMVAAILKPYVEAKADSRQHLREGKSRNSAMDAVRENLAAGFACIIELDVKNCFPSIDPRNFAPECVNSFTPLPLPRRVIENVVMSSEEALSRFHGYQTYCDAHGWHNSVYGNHKMFRDASCGLPQGSLVSALIQAWVMSELLRYVPDTDVVRVVNYGDNFLIMAWTKADAEAAAQTLQAAATLRSQGRMNIIQRNAPKHVRYGFDFLGYRITKTNRGTTATPTTKNLAKIDKALFSSIIAFDINRDLASWRKLCRIVSGLRSGYASSNDQSHLHSAIWSICSFHCRFAGMAKRIADLLTGTPIASRGLPLLSLPSPGSRPFIPLHRLPHVFRHHDHRIKALPEELRPHVQYVRRRSIDIWRVQTVAA